MFQVKKKIEQWNEKYETVEFSVEKLKRSPKRVSC